MTCRPLLLELQLRNGSVCRACRLSLGLQRPTGQGLASYSTESAPLRRRGRTTRRAARPQVRTQEPDAAMQRAMQQAQTIKPSQQTSDAPYTVRYFEQEDETSKVVPLRDGDEFDRSMKQVDSGELQNNLMSLRGVGQTSEERLAFDRVIRAIGPALNDIRGPEDLEKISARLKAYSASIDRRLEKFMSEFPEDVAKELRDLDLDDDLQEMDLEAEPEPPSQEKIPAIPENPWTPNQRRKISRLNLAMKRVDNEIQQGSDLTSAHVTSVYKAYHSARLTLARAWSHVPLDVWDFLWMVFAADESVNNHRLSHVSLLSRDMSEANVDLAPSQQLLTIEAVFVDGWEAKALESWKRCMSTLGDPGSESFKDFWELGVRMHCRLGDLEQAQRASNKLLEKSSDPRILMPLIRSLSEKGTTEDAEKAWATYRQMRELLGNSMELSDYDQVISYFLTTNQVENALQAFVDMMSDGQINLRKQHFMPSVVANKFFLGKWLKRLIGAGDLDGAYSVVKFMRERGVGASPIQLNGLIGAWLRSGSAEHLKKADDLAWEMIAARIDFVKTRASKSIKVQAQEAWRTTKPRATLETFCLMADNYRLRSLHDQQEALWEAFRDSQISPDAFMMNSLVESYIKAGQVSEALKQYRVLVDEQGVKPDPYTFSALWKTLNINNLHVNPEASQAEILKARQLFAETVKYKHVFPPEGMDGQLSRKILHTFRRLKDTPATMVALITLKDVFNFVLPDTLALEMTIGTMKLSWDSPTQRRKLMSAKREMDLALQESVGGQGEQPEGAERAEALHLYLLRKLGSSIGDEKVLSESIDTAVADMGVLDVLASDSE
ncbi:PPR repeat family protein [Sarocladium implicatum]|nr:PPR repeat family protein [Sarocladium implicatum]